MSSENALTWPNMYMHVCVCVSVWKAFNEINECCLTVQLIQRSQRDIASHWKRNDESKYLSILEYADT